MCLEAMQRIKQTKDVFNFLGPTFPNPALQPALLCVPVHQNKSQSPVLIKGWSHLDMLSHVEIFLALYYLTGPSNFAPCAEIISRDDGRGTWTRALGWREHKIHL